MKLLSKLLETIKTILNMIIVLLFFLSVIVLCILGLAAIIGQTDFVFNHMTIGWLSIIYFMGSVLVSYILLKKDKHPM